MQFELCVCLFTFVSIRFSKISIYISIHTNDEKMQKSIKSSVKALCSVEKVYSKCKRTETNSRGSSKHSRCANVWMFDIGIIFYSINTQRWWKCDSMKPLIVAHQYSYISISLFCKTINTSDFFRTCVAVGTVMGYWISPYTTNDMECNFEIQNENILISFTIECSNVGCNLHVTGNFLYWGINKVTNPRRRDSRFFESNG
jgi:hypothetical protein